MEELTFRIVLVPKKNFIPTEQYLKEYKRYLSQCDLYDIKVNVLKIERTEEKDYPEIEEFILQVHASLHLSPRRRISDYYQELCFKWKRVFDSKPTPLLLFHESSSFVDYRQLSHTLVSYNNLSFGVLPYNGEFHQYASLSHKGHVDFLHDERKVNIAYCELELTFSYTNIRNIFVNIDPSTCEVFFDLCNPPIVFLIEHKRSNGNFFKVRHLIASILHIDPRQKQEELDSDTLGRSNVLRISFNKPVDEIIGRIHARCSKKPIHYGYIYSVKKEKPIFPQDFVWNHFGCMYLITAIMKRNFTMAAQSYCLYESFLHLMELNLGNEDCMEKSLNLVLSAVDAGKVINFWFAIKKQFEFYKKNKGEIDYVHYIIPENCRMIRRVTLTPTRQLLWPPEIMMSNRVLRNFDSDYSLRVSFRDDNHSRLSFVAVNAEYSVFEKAILQPMLKGIRIGSRHYEFLAWSNSQIRDHGLWMYATDYNGNNARTIRTWMGDFSHIHSIPKYMARMGQCFSQTEDAVSIPFDELFIRLEDDIVGGFDPVNRKPYCFSDGIGKISVAMAEKVHTALGHDKLCSAFQIRYGGFKGMLVVDPTMKDTDIVFRKSMKKFDSPESIKLEIAKTSAPTPLQLNRPFIMILNDLGVRHRTFLKLQEDMLRNLTDILIDEEQAREYLHTNTPTNVFKYKELSESGIHLTTEPFFRSMLLALHRHHVDKIKTKANIMIDPNEGRNMLGVLDETGNLQPGEVFVQYTEDISFGETTRTTVVLEGTVVVTKNPCLLPGDVRKFNAVNVPELHHIVDCIAFPRRGWRPHPDEMAGSDLDGDEYTVLWNKDLIFHCDNKEPGDFLKVSVQEVEEITVPDMINFFIDYIKNDQVGSIASTHLAQADQTSIFSDVCLGIAKKFSIAVDFAKTGVSQHLKPEERPKKFPDFMERQYQETYKSTKALGKMYRVVKDYESENQEASMTYRDLQMDADLLHPGWEKYKNSALASRKKYISLLKTILRNYGIEHEAEVFSGAFTNFHCHFRDRKDLREIEKVIILCIKRLSKSMLEEFHEEFVESGNVNTIDNAILQKASAWYAVTYWDKYAEFLSFPWIVSQYLAKIKIRKSDVYISSYSPIVSKMDLQINKNESKYKTCDTFIKKQMDLYAFMCDPNIVKKALGVLLDWAQEENVIPPPDACTDEVDRSSIVFRRTFIKLFFFVAERSSYIVKRGSEAIREKTTYSAASLCLDFLRFCLKLRFYNKQEVLEVMPFHMLKYSTLSKRAVVAYHRFAVFGVFQSLCRDSRYGEDLVEMRPVYIDSKIFPHTPITNSSLMKAQNALKKHSKVDDIWLREIRQTKKVLVSAVGTEQSLKLLKCILRKKPETLTRLFQT